MLFGCIICGKFVGRDHKCSPQALTSFKRSEATKEAQRGLRRRYGAGETYGDKLQAAANFKGINGNERYRRCLVTKQ